MKTIGILTDNYKLEKFKRELTDKRFTDIEVVPFTTLTSNIKVKIDEKQVKDINKICMEVDLYFKRSN